MIRLGYKMKLYKKGGNSSRNLEEDVTWRQAVNSGVENKIHTDWVIWKTAKEMKKYSGELRKLRTTELGCVHNPIDVVERIQNGEYKYLHPRFE